MGCSNQRGQSQFQDPDDRHGGASWPQELVGLASVFGDVLFLEGFLTRGNPQVYYMYYTNYSTVIALCMMSFGSHVVQSG